MRQLRVIAPVVVFALLCVGVVLLLIRGRTRQPSPADVDWTALGVERGAIIDWDAHNDSKENLPLLKSTDSSSSLHYRRLSRWHFWTRFDEKPIDGVQYAGLLVTCTYGDIERLSEQELEARLNAADADPACRVVSLYVRRFAEPEPRIDIRLVCKVPLRISFENFDGGVVRDADTGQGCSDETFGFSPGEYHLEAVMPEAPDGE